MKYIFLLFILIAKLSSNEITDKKNIFIKAVLPSIQKVHNNLYKQYLYALKDINSSQNKELLISLKPHPISITLAQAALESGWGTSRFFKQANNIFGVWIKDSSDSKIAALQKRGKRTIWLKKFKSFDESILDYYHLLSTAPAYKEFKRLNMKTDNPYLIAEKLNHYSELGVEYTKRVKSVIRHNNFTKYDKK